MNKYLHSLTEYPFQYLSQLLKDINKDPTKNIKNGVGAFLYTDHVGPTIRTGFQASYAYHLKINDN